MRTNMETDDRPMADALQATGLQTKKEVIEIGLKILIILKNKALLARQAASLNGGG